MFCMWIWSSKAKAALPNCVCRREHNFFHTSVSSSQPDNRHPLLPNIKRIFSPFFSSYVWHFWQIGTIFFNHPWHTSHRKTYVLHQIKPIISFLLSFVSLYPPFSISTTQVCSFISYEPHCFYWEHFKQKRISSWSIDITSYNEIETTRSDKCGSLIRQKDFSKEASFHEILITSKTMITFQNE